MRSSKHRPEPIRLFYEYSHAREKLLGHRHITTPQIYDNRRIATQQSASHDMPMQSLPYPLLYRSQFKTIINHNADAHQTSLLQTLRFSCSSIRLSATTANGLPCFERGARNIIAAAITERPTAPSLEIVGLKWDGR